MTPEQQLQALGITLPEMVAAAEAAGEPVEGGFRFTEVAAGPELHRILAAPRRPVPDPLGQEAEQQAAFLTQRLARKTEGLYPGPLRPVQGLALAEAWRSRGGFFPIVVGGGKMLTTYLLPAILGSKRPVLFAPASMEVETRREFGKYALSWRGPALPSYPFFSYEKLSSPSSAPDFAPDGSITRHGLLERLRPDLIVLDECHCLADSGSPRAKRLNAYLTDHPDTVVVALSGTPFLRSIKDASHILRWCFRARAPLPVDFLEREQWASYLDARAGQGPRCSVGALTELLDPAELRRFAAAVEPDDARGEVRSALARRILETPGVIGTQEPPLPIPLYISAVLPTDEDPALEEAFEDLRTTWCLPDDTELADGMQYARHADTYGMGFYQRYEPKPLDEYLLARNEWASWCRKAIRYNRKGIDSESRMKAAVRKGLIRDEGVLEAWETAEKAWRADNRPLLEPPSVAQWISNECIERVREWLAEHPEGLVWVRFIGLGVRLSDELGIPYYGAEGLDARGRHILQHPPRTAAIASIAANGTGKNLQHQWDKNLWLGVPNEQNLGRTHRPGQRADAVRNWIYVGCPEHLKSYYAASTQKARFSEELTLRAQKLRNALTSMPTMRDIGIRPGHRWSIKRGDAGAEESESDE